MMSVGIRELKDNAPRLLRRGEVLRIQRHGRDVGVYLPLEQLDELPLEVRLYLYRLVTDEIGRAARRKKDR